MKNIVCVLVSLVCVLNCYSMDNLGKINIKDAIRDGNIKYFNRYCEARNNLGIEGRKIKKNKPIYLGNGDYDILFANSNLFYQICSSQHKNSVDMLRVLLNDYSGKNGYTFKNLGHKFFSTIFDTCGLEYEAISLAIQKISCILDKKELLAMDCSTIKNIFGEFANWASKSVGNKDSVEVLQYRLLNAHIQYACNSLKKEKNIDRLKSFLDLGLNEKYFIKRDFFKKEGNRLLHDIMQRKNFFKDINMALQILNVLLEYGAFRPEDKEKACEILEELEKVEWEFDLQVAFNYYALYFGFKNSYDMYYKNEEEATKNS